MKSAVCRQALVIAGGGIAGLSLALAVRQALGEGVEIVMADPAFGKARAESRAYAVSAAAVRMLGVLGVWPDVAAAAQAITRMEISDSRTHDVVRPAFLSFAADGEAGDPFAYMIESATLQQALAGACVRHGVSLQATPVLRADGRDPAVDVRFGDGTSMSVNLVVAADGARSKLREQSGIGWVGWSYRQSGIVATITHERDHQGVAVEHFLPSGPFAILPLISAGGQHRSSIVWTEASGHVDALLALDDDDLLVEIERRFGLQLGAIGLSSRPRAWPLSFGIARRFVGERLALLGDAAHVIHPIAGQGLNLGLKDAAALSEAIVDAARLGLDIGSAPVLRDYERQRRPDTVAMGAVTDGLNRLFSNDVTPVRLVRDFGLGLVERLPHLKQLFIGEAAGNPWSGDVPRLLKGQPL